MAFSGVDYHAAFEEACEKLARVRDADEVRSDLEGIEWILWEAIRGVFFLASIIAAWFIVVPVFYFLVDEKTFVAFAIEIAIVIMLAAALYWLLRLVFHFEIAKHVKGRRFGSGGLDR